MRRHPNFEVQAQALHATSNDLQLIKGGIEMEKLDLRKELKHLYGPLSKQFSLVEVPEMNFIMIDGHGDPNHSADYAEAVNALYSLAYTLKFSVKAGLKIDYTVMALEGLWWAEDMAAFVLQDKSNWLWTMMIMQPEFITPELFAEAREQAARKKDLPALERVRLEPFNEGLSVQIMYFGPYADEGPTIARLHEFIRTEGYEPAGKHHEIYLGDPRKSAPEKLKTVIRQPIRRAVP
jgi:hypothetical protein